MSSQDEIDNKSSTGDGAIPINTQKRRVHFPSDESKLRIISIASEPFANQPLQSLGVTLQRYRGACQRSQIRPLNCLLDQLSVMEDNRKSFNDRLNCLKIVNERLDVKHIDTIEEILSRCRFQTINVESSISDDLTLIQLFDVIEYYDSCTHLNLSNTRAIGVQGYQALARCLRRARCLERLDMNSMRFDDTSLLGFGRALRLSTTLYELHVESCQLNGRILQRFVQNLRSCTGIRELYLCDNRLQVQDSLIINELIRFCGQFLHLLDLRSNSLQDNGISHIASQFSQYDENHVHENSICKVSFHSNQITSQGVGFLAKSLLHNRTIRSLNLSHNQIGNEGLFLLRDALLTNRTINELILQNCRLNDQAAIALAEYIAESATIQYIDLRENNIQASGICGLAIAIKNNKSLLKVDFDSIISTTKNSNFQTNNNIDRTATQSNSLLSLSNLRRMTVGFSGFTSNMSYNSNGSNTQELLEQKAKWMNDIECVCQRNLILYEEHSRQQEEHENATTNGINKHEEKSLTTTNENGFERESISSTSETNGHSVFFLDDNSEDASLTSDEFSKPTENLTNDICEHEQSSDVSIGNISIKESQIDLSTIDIDEIRHLLADLVESAATTIDKDEPVKHKEVENERLSVSSSDSEPIEDNLNKDFEPKIQHSDSLYILRKKIQHDADDTSEDEAELSSLNEEQEEADMDLS